MRIISFILIILIILLGVSFALLNSTSVSVNYYIGQRTLPLSLLIVYVFVIGCLVGLLVASWVILKSKVKIRRLRKRLELAEKEVQNLRAIPLQDKH